MLVVEHLEERVNGLKSEYRTRTNYLMETVEVSFLLPYRDWLKLENSEAWKSLDEFLLEVQKPDMQMFHPEKLVVAEKVLYKNPLLEHVQVACERLKQLHKVVFRKNSEYHR